MLMMEVVVYKRMGAAFCFFMFVCLVESEIDPAWQNVFRTRSNADWRALWHIEKHRRCYQDLLVHMDWVCEKDIYKLDKKSFPSAVHNGSPEVGMYPFIPATKAFNFLGNAIPSRLKRTQESSQAAMKRGIIDECCHGTTGCSWEEYAEYCPANRRVRT